MHACSEKSLQTGAKNIFEKMGKSRVGRALASIPGRVFAFITVRRTTGPGIY